MAAITVTWLFPWWKNCAGKIPGNGKKPLNMRRRPCRFVSVCGMACWRVRDNFISWTKILGMVLIRKGFVCLWLIIGGTYTGTAQYTNIHNSYTSPDTPRLVIERAMIYTPTTQWLYNHHASIAKFKGRLIAIWSDGRTDEDAPGQRVVFSLSKDFFHWSAPQVLAEPSCYRGDTANILTAAGFHRYGNNVKADTLV